MWGKGKGMGVVIDSPALIRRLERCLRCQLVSSQILSISATSSRPAVSASQRRTFNRT